MDKLTDTIRSELGRFGPQADIGAVIERWPSAVGDAIAQNAWPSRIGQDGTLHANTADAIWAFELTQRAAEIAGRLGVATVRFTPGPLAGSTVAAAAQAAPRPSAEQLREAAEIASVIEAENLRETVEKVVSLSLARGGSDRVV